MINISNLDEHSISRHGIYAMNPRRSPKLWFKCGLHSSEGQLWAWLGGAEKPKGKVKLAISLFTFGFTPHSILTLSALSSSAPRGLCTSYIRTNGKCRRKGNCRLRFRPRRLARWKFFSANSPLCAPSCARGWLVRSFFHSAAYSFSFSRSCYCFTSRLCIRVTSRPFLQKIALRDEMHTGFCLIF